MLSGPLLPTQDEDEVVGTGAVGAGRGEGVLAGIVERADVDVGAVGRVVPVRRVAGTMGCELVYVLVPKSGSFAELAEQPTREQAARDVKSVVHTMALEDQKPGNTNQLIEDEAQRRLNRRKTR